MSRLLDPLRQAFHAAIPLPLKYGAEYRRCYKRHRSLQQWSCDEIARYQFRRLQAIVDYAVIHVPFYRRVYGALGFRAGDLNTPADFLQLPCIHKDDVFQFGEEFKSDEFERLRPIKTVTSATTRDGMVMYRSARAETIRRAIVWRHWFNLGYRYREPRVQLTTALASADKSAIHDDLSENCRQIDPRAITLELAPRLYSSIREFRPRLIYAQPSNLAALVLYWRQRQLAPFQVPIVYLVGEKIYPEYRDIIADFFGGQIREYYGNRENTASAGELADGRLYVHADFVHLEFLDDAGQPVVGAPANIVSTGFENYAFPLIRYHTEDVGIDRDHPAQALVGFPTLEIVGGRNKDLLLTPEGLFCPYMASQLRDVGFSRFKRVQLEQTAADRVLVRVEPTADFEFPRDREIIENAYRKYLGRWFTVEVAIVDTIPPSGYCKNRMVISELALQELRQQPAFSSTSHQQKESGRRADLPL